MEMGYLTVLHVRSGAKIGDLHAKDSNAFCKRLINLGRNRAKAHPGYVIGIDMLKHIV